MHDGLLIIVIECMTKVVNARGRVYRVFNRNQKNNFIVMYMSVREDWKERRSVYNIYTMNTIESKIHLFFMKHGTRKFLAGLCRPVSSIYVV